MKALAIVGVAVATVYYVAWWLLEDVLKDALSGYTGAPIETTWAGLWTTTGDGALLVTVLGVLYRLLVLVPPLVVVWLFRRQR